MNVPVTPSPPERDPLEEVRLALQALLRSPELERAGRLQAFLRFIVERTLAGEADQINESLIAAEVFQRPGYNSQDDSSVRRQAHALRSKLQRYYAGEGADQPIRIELPVGRYVPLFRRGDEIMTVPSSAPRPITVLRPEVVAHPAPPRANEEVSPPEPPPPAPTPPSRRRALLGIAGTALFGAGALIGSRASSPSSGITSIAVDPVLQRLWGGWLRPGSFVTVCVSTPPTLHIKREPTRPPEETRGGLTVPPDQAELLREHFDLPAGGELRLHLKRSAMSKYGELLGTAQLATLFAQAGMTMIVRQSRNVSIETFQREDVVVLGNDENNPWIEQLLSAYPLQMLPPTSDTGRRIVDTSAPQSPSASFSYPEPSGDGLSEVFGLVSLLPGIAPQRRLLTLTGLGNTTTQLATEFMTDPVRGAELETALRAANGGKLPAHFQAVVKIGVRGRSPVRGAVVLARAV